jgi:hypothetical protein
VIDKKVDPTFRTTAKKKVKKTVKKKDVQYRYVYFVFFLSASGYGNLEVNVDEEIDNIDKVKKVEALIQQKQNRNNVSVINFQYMRTEEVLL